MCSKKHWTHSEKGVMQKSLQRCGYLLAFASPLFLVDGSQGLATTPPRETVVRWEQEISPSPTPEFLQVERRLARRGFERAINRRIDTIVLHSCYNPGPSDRYSVEAILALFSRERVSAHYLIDREGQIYQLVDEENIAYHAGDSRWQERRGVNRFSIGIELINHTEDRYTEAQYRSLELLLRDIERRHTIRFLLAHGEIASERRSDPWNFDWARVAQFRNRSPETRLSSPATK